MRLTTESLFRRVGFWLGVAEVDNPPAFTGGVLQLLAADYLAWTALAEDIEPEKALELVRHDQLFRRLDQARRLVKPPDCRAEI